MAHLYVAQGRGGLLKIGMTHYMPSRLPQLKTMFRKKGDEVERVYVFPSIDKARTAEFYIEKELAGILPRHSGNEWFVGGDFDEVLRVMDAALDLATINRRAERRCLKAAFEARSARIDFYPSKAAA